MNVAGLSAGNITLLPYSDRHDAKTVAWLNSTDLREAFGITRIVSAESHRAWIAEAADVAIWAIHDAQNTHCGNVLLHINPRHRSAYFQIYIGERQSRGRGIGRTALYLVLAEAFERLDIHRVWLHTLPGNAAAESLYRSAGFSEEGVEREGLLREGGFVSQRRWSMLEQEWKSDAKKAGA